MWRSCSRTISSCSEPPTRPSRPSSSAALSLPSSSAAARSYRSGSCCASTWRRIGRRYAGSRVRRSCWQASPCFCSRPRATARCSCSTACARPCCTRCSSTSPPATSARATTCYGFACGAIVLCTARYGRSSPASCLRTSCSCWSSTRMRSQVRGCPSSPSATSPRTRSCCAAASPPARARGAACRYDAPNRPRREAHRSRRSSTRISQPTRPRDSCRSARPRCCDSCCWARTTRTSPHPCILRRAPSRCTCTISSRRPSGLTARSLSRIFPARSYCR